MKINEIIVLLPVFFAGIVLGILFFGGLWLTVQKGLKSKNSALIFTGSFILRMALLMLGFYYVSANSWQRALICLSGFLIARVVFIRIKKNQLSKVNLVKDLENET